MGMRDGSFTTTAPLLLRNSDTSLFVFADNFVIYVAGKSKLLRLLRYLLTTAFILFLRLLPSLSPTKQDIIDHHRTSDNGTSHSPPYAAARRRGDCGIARALSQLLSIVNTVPVSSRKYDVVRSLAEQLIDENHAQGNEKLRDVNRTVLAAAFARNLSQFEDAAVERDSAAGESSASRPVLRVFRRVWVKVGLMRTKVVHRPDDSSSAEKLVAELLWLAQKMAACGCADEAVLRWASASSLARLSLTMEPRLQGSLVKISAFLFKQARNVEEHKTEAIFKNEPRQRRIKMNMLMFDGLVLRVD